MIYTVTIISDQNEIRFGFNQFTDMTDFLAVAIETVDGFEEGKTQVIVGKEKEAPK